jgi:hypothetical protein
VRELKLTLQAQGGKDGAFSTPFVYLDLCKLPQITDKAGGSLCSKESFLLLLNHDLIDTPHLSSVVLVIGQDEMDEQARGWRSLVLNRCPITQHLSTVNGTLCSAACLGLRSVAA